MSNLGYAASLLFSISFGGTNPQRPRSEKNRMKKIVNFGEGSNTEVENERKPIRKICTAEAIPQGMYPRRTSMYTAIPRFEVWM